MRFHAPRSPYRWDPGTFDALGPIRQVAAGWRVDQVFFRVPQQGRAGDQRDAPLT